MSQPIAIASSTQADLGLAVDELRDALAPIKPVLVLVFYSSVHPADRMASLTAAAFPSAHTAGCSTMGELADGCFVRGGLSAIAFGPQAKFALECIHEARDFRYQEGAALVGRMCASLGRVPTSLRAERHIFLTLVDGLAGIDELLLASISEVAPAVPLVGACAADDEHFDATSVFADGVATGGGAILLLLEPGVAFEPFALNHYQATGQRVVVTRCDSARREVSELNGWPALPEYARLCGVDAEVFARDPLLMLGQPVQFGVQSQDVHFLRGVMTGHDDVLVLAGAVDEGEILDVMQAVDIVESTRKGLAEHLGRLPGPAAALLAFSCGGRFHAADREGVLAALSQAMTPVPTCGFSTYGEHFGALLVNYTLTGVAFSLSGQES